MELQAQLSKDLQNAMKSRDAARMSALRMTISAVRNKEVEKKKALVDSEVLEVIAAQAKTRRESIEEFRKGGRIDLQQKEEAELVVLQAYLPAPLTDAEIRELAQKSIQTVAATSPKDMGKVMSALMPQLKGRADGKQAQQIVQQLLTGQ